MAKRRHPPNRHLAWARLQRGWSYEELADQVRRSMIASGDGDSGLTANTVRRWETGERWPEPRFRKHLVTLFGQAASELGLLTPDELAMRPTSDVISEIGRLLSMTEDELRAQGIDRAAFLRGFLGVGALPLMGRLTGDHDEERIWLAGARGTRADGGTAGAYTRIVASQRDLYWGTPARSLFESAYAHARIGSRLLESASGDHARRMLACGLAETAMLAGRLAFFDLRQPSIAQHCYTIALNATRESGDHAFAAVVLGHMAFIPGFARETSRALELVDAAGQHCWYGVGPLIRSWLHCVAAEIVGRSAQPADYRRRIDLAEEAADSPEPAPDWFDFYDASRLDGFAGYSALAAGDITVAEQRLTRALASLAPAATKQRTVLMADLAMAHLGDAAQAAALVEQALDLLRVDWYATGYERVGMVASQLPVGADRDRVRDRYRALAPAEGW